MYIPLQLPVYWLHWPPIFRHRKSLRVGGFELVDGDLYEFPPGNRGDWIEWMRKIMNASPGSRICISVLCIYICIYIYNIRIYICIYIYILANCKDQVGERMLKALQTEMGEYSFSSG